MAVTLGPITETEFEKFMEESILEYARDNVVTGRWTTEESVAAATKDYWDLLPERLQTKGQYFFSIFDSNEVRVGNVWFGHMPAEPGLVWINQITIDPEYRRKGFATQALELVEKKAAELGFRRIGLHVFGHNTTAYQCYLAAKFTTKNIILEKPLSSEASRQPSQP